MIQFILLRDGRLELRVDALNDFFSIDTQIALQFNLNIFARVDEWHHGLTFGNDKRSSTKLMRVELIISVLLHWSCSKSHKFSEYVVSSSTLIFSLQVRLIFKFLLAHLHKHAKLEGSASCGQLVWIEAYKTSIAVDDHLADKHASIKIGVLVITFTVCIIFLSSMRLAKDLAKLCLSLLVNAFALINDLHA